MDINVLAAFGQRHIDAEPVALVDLPNRSRQLHPRGIHRHLLEPPVPRARHNDDHIGWIGLRHPRGDCRRNLCRGKILILDINKALCGSYHVEGELLDFSYLFYFAVAGTGSGNCKIDIFKQH